MHVWGDDWPYWGDLDEVVGLVNYYASMGLLNHNAKEKWGELRWYTDINGAQSLHDIFRVGHYYYEYTAENRPIMNIIDQMSYSYLRPFRGLSIKYKQFIYGLAYHKAVGKFPHITKEILGCVEHPQFLFKREAKLYNNIDAI